MGIEDIALNVRRQILKTAYKNKAGHIASSLSAVELLTVLYCDNVLKYKANEPNWKERDRFILSKGHASLALYYILAECGYFKKDELDSFCIAGTIYGGEPLKNKVLGVEASTGSLGHGLSYACGIAMNAKIFNETYGVYVMLGDGECEEGAVWEAALFASKQKLNNLTVIIDNNKLQATDSVENILCVTPITEKWSSFGFEVIEIDGHNIMEIKKSLSLKSLNKPKVIIANTIKGKGISFIENKTDWHYKLPTDNEIKIAIAELQMTEKEFNLL